MKLLELMFESFWHFIGFTILFNGIRNPFKIIFGIYVIASLIGVFYGITKTKETLNNEVCINKGIVIDRINNRFII